jgi:predicted Rossmann-fold nucleotide-binding protein
LIQTKKTGKFPVILVGTAFWTGLLDWIKSTLLEKENNISAKDLDLIKIVDSADEAVNEINIFYKQNTHSPNF